MKNKIEFKHNRIKWAIDNAMFAALIGGLVFFATGNKVEGTVVSSVALSLFFLNSLVDIALCRNVHVPDFERFLRADPNEPPDGEDSRAVGEPGD